MGKYRRSNSYPPLRKCTKVNIVIPDGLDMQQDLAAPNIIANDAYILHDFTRTDENAVGIGSSNKLHDSCFLLWLILDASNSWTWCALHLLATDQDAMIRIQQEINFLLAKYGSCDIFHTNALSEMVVVDALIHEAIRLTPPFCGGVHKLKETVALQEEGLQLPAGISVIFSACTNGAFNLESAIGKNPSNLGHSYPTSAL